VANPIFTRNKQFQGDGVVQQAPVRGLSPRASASTLEQQLNAPSGTAFETGRMSYEGTLLKSAGFFGLAVLSAAAVGVLMPGATNFFGIAAFVLMLVVAFSRNHSPVLLGVTLAAFGGFAGGFTVLLESNPTYNGIAMQALVATASVFAAVLILFRSGKIRATAKMNRYVMIAMVGYVLFSLVNIGFMMFTDIDGFGLRSQDIPGTSIAWGIPIGIFAVLLGAYMLLRDFTFIENGVKTGIPAKHEWLAAYGIVFTIIWLYIEFLRLLAILRGR